MKNELKHEEPPWRTPVTKEWRDKMKDERIRLKPCEDLDEVSGEMSEEIWTPEKKRWKHLELEFIHQERTLKEGITHLDEIRIRFIVCLSFIKLNWWQAMDLHITYSSWKGLRIDISQTWEGLHEPPVGLKRTSG